MVEKKADAQFSRSNEIIEYENYVNPFKWDPIKDVQIENLQTAFCSRGTLPNR